jgi:hypothetical protein
MLEFGKQQKDGLPFGAKTVEELEARDKANNPPPVEPEVKTEPTVTDANKPDPVKPVEPKKEEIKTEPVKIDWLGEVNKSYKTEFKTPEEFGAVFEKAKRVDEYEPKIKGYEESEIKYKKQLEELQSSLNPLNYFSSQESYVAEQLRRQHPDKSPYVLQQIVTSDNKRMDDLDVLIKNQMLETPDLIGGEQGAREYILDKYGVDPATPKEEWSITLQNKIKIEANAARKAWDELKSKVVVPKVQTPEEKEADLVRIKEEKKIQLTPIKEIFSKFDKFTEEIEPGKVLDFIVPDEYKQTLPDMFEAYFVEAGIEPTKENLVIMEDLKKGIMLGKYIKQIYKVIEGDVETRMKAERDILLNNTKPSNTQTAAEEELDEKQKLSKEQGFGKLFSK